LGDYPAAASIWQVDRAGLRCTGLKGLIKVKSGQFNSGVSLKNEKTNDFYNLYPAFIRFDWRTAGSLRIKFPRNNFCQWYHKRFNFRRTNPHATALHRLPFGKPGHIRPSYCCRLEEYRGPHD